MNEAVWAALQQGVAELMSRFETEPSHVLHVRNLAVTLFDDLSAEPGLTSEDRAILDVASCLHDIGWAVTQPDGRSHHKESARLIREHAWTGVSRSVVEGVALVARYHRKAIPSEVDHEDFVRQALDDRRRIRWLAGLLRVADGLDRRHIQAVQTVHAVRLWKALRIGLTGVDGMEAEILGARKKADLLEEISGCEVVIGAGV